MSEIVFLPVLPDVAEALTFRKHVPMRCAVSIVNSKNMKCLARVLWNPVAGFQSMATLGGVCQAQSLPSHFFFLELSCIQLGDLHSNFGAGRAVPREVCKPQELSVFFPCTRTKTFSPFPALLCRIITILLLAGWLRKEITRLNGLSSTIVDLGAVVHRNEHSSPAFAKP